VEKYLEMAFPFKRILFLAFLGVTTFIVLITHLLPCHSRTNTTKQQVFNLKRPHPVSYEFQTLSPSIKITVPRSSKWSSVNHHHFNISNCESIRSLSGTWSISSLPYYKQWEEGTSICTHCVRTQQPREYMSWGPYMPTNDSSMNLTAPVQFYRTVCSVTQDADRYFRQCDTPLWLRSIYTSTYLLPILGGGVREWMINTALGYQLRVIYEKNDFWPYAGEFKATEESEKQFVIPSRYGRSDTAVLRGS
jgi:hypothetical protein